MRMCVSGWSALVLVSCLASAAVGQRRDGVPIDRSADEVKGDEVLSTVTELIEPGYAGASPMLPSLTPVEVEQMRRRYLENREMIASRVNNNPIDPRPPSAWPSGPATAAGGDSSLAKSHGSAASLLVGQNYFNSLAASVGSNLPEPSAVNDGVQVFWTGNTYASYSINGGASFSRITIPPGPADAPYACCDLDVVHDKARGATFWSVLYTNGTQTNGVVRIYFRPTIDSYDTCYYQIDPGGAADNLLPDFPHLSLSNNHLYLTTNEIVGGAWSRSVVRRFNIDQMIDCVTATTDTSTFTSTTLGQRVFVPAEGATQTMYWGQMESASSFRLYSWPQSASAPTSSLKTIGTSNFTNPDCRGGVGNADWIERATAWNIAGFRMRGAVGKNQVTFYWPVGPDATTGHAQGHLHGVVVRESDGAVTNQPAVYNAGFCWSCPAITANARGDLAAVIAGGGRAGGGGTAAQGYVGIADDFTPATDAPFGATLTLVASGTHNLPASDPNGNRYGDYVSIHRHSPCDNFFVATSYGLYNGTAAANVNAHYVEFGRGRDSACYYGWRDETRVP